MASKLICDLCNKDLSPDESKKPGSVLHYILKGKKDAPPKKVMIAVTVHVDANAGDVCNDCIGKTLANKPDKIE